MSGIAGVIGSKTKEESVLEILESIRYRGKIEPVLKKVSNGIIGIVEMSDEGRNSVRGISQNGSCEVIVDGMLYNEEIGSKPAAVYIREEFEKNGKAALSKLDGSFSCAISSDDETIVARDGVGARPVIYGTNDEGTFYFASEAKGLKNLVNEVKELPPGHFFSTKEGLKAFQTFVPEVPDFDSPAEAARILKEILVKAVEKSMADGKVGGVSLSGGLDSSIILAIAKEFNPRIEASSVSIKGQPGEDIEYAKLMARSAGIKLHTYDISMEDITAIIPKAVWHLESFDEDCISGYIANFYASRLASDFTGSVLVGEGADELFGGYFRELENIEDESEKERVAKKLVEVAYNTALRRLDRGWMTNSVDYRAPFLDSAVVAFSEKIPMDLKVYAGKERSIEKWILREAFRDMIPKEIADRPKMRFARGVGVDDFMDMSVQGKITQKDFEDTPSSEGGLALNSPKELYFYRLFREFFPIGYESMTARWDPHK